MEIHAVYFVLTATQFVLGVLTLRAYRKERQMILDAWAKKHAKDEATIRKLRQDVKVLRAAYKDAMTASDRNSD